MPNPESLPDGEKAILERFPENLYPSKRRKGEKYPGLIIDRLHKAGCRVKLVRGFLFAYALRRTKPRGDKRERGRTAFAFLERMAEASRVEAHWHTLHGREPRMERSARFPSHLVWERRSKSIEGGARPAVGCLSVPQANR